MNWTSIQSTGYALYLYFTIKTIQKYYSKYLVGLLYYCVIDYCKIATEPKQCQAAWEDM